MALDVTLTAVTSPDSPTDPATAVRVRQNGFEESPRWRRHYGVVGLGWERALYSLRMLLEKWTR